MNKIIGIYKIISPSKKVYIGQSKNIEKRFSSYKCLGCKSQTHIYNSLKKYGVKKHKFEIIHQCEVSELNDLEIYYIDIYQSFNSNFGLNLRSGGKCKINVSDETKAKLSNSRKGRVMSEKTKDILRQYRMNQIDPTITRKVINNNTGEIYNSIKEVAIMLNLKYTTFKMMMYGKNRNKTNFELLNKN